MPGEERKKITPSKKDDKHKVEPDKGEKFVPPTKSPKEK
jgi:hypothetical protein